MSIIIFCHILKTRGYDFHGFLQCRSRAEFIGGGMGEHNECRRSAVLGGSEGMLPGRFSGSLK